MKSKKLINVLIERRFLLSIRVWECLVCDRQTVGLLVWTKSTWAGANASCSDKCTHSQHTTDREKSNQALGQYKKKEKGSTFLSSSIVEYQKKTAGAIAGTSPFLSRSRRREQNKKKTKKRRSNSGSDAAEFSITSCCIVV